MALTPFFGSGPSSIFDPFESGFWDRPVDPWSSGLFGKNLGKEDVQAVASTRIDWVETPEAHVFKADLPGLQKEDVKVTVEGDRTLQISGERTREEEKKTDTWHRVERSHGKFLRRFRLPHNANVESVNAKVENGVLTVTVLKTQQPEREVRVVNID
jgi:HSP20 family protein